MRVSVIVNPKAGSVNAELVEAKIRESLFRCDLHFCTTDSLANMQDFLAGEIASKTDYLIVCGGDGTVNITLQCLMGFQNTSALPPLLIVKSGTANDLAYEIGVSHRIDHAVRNIFDGTIRNIDIIEIKSEEKVSYMLTNGGLGIPALAAELANEFRSYLSEASTNTNASRLIKHIIGSGSKMVRSLGPTLYPLMVAEGIRRWKKEDWEVEVELPGQKTRTIHSPVILVNNQRSTGAKFLPAPLTSNSDGFVNLMWTESNNRRQHTLAALRISKGSLHKDPSFKSFELKEFKIKNKNPNRSLTFFGDGEILQKNVQSLDIRCLHQGLRLVVR